MGWTLQFLQLYLYFVIMKIAVSYCAYALTARNKTRIGIIRIRVMLFSRLCLSSTSLSVNLCKTGNKTMQDY